MMESMSIGLTSSGLNRPSGEGVGEDSCDERLGLEMMLMIEY